MKWKLGNLAGIGVYLHWSFWLLPAWIMISSGGGLAGAMGSLLFVFAIFGCVVLHELGHALMARQYGIARATSRCIRSAVSRAWSACRVDRRRNSRLRWLVPP